MQLGPTVIEQLTAGSDLDRAAVQGPPPFNPDGIRPTAVGLALTPSGSSLSQATTGMPWPNIVDGANKFFVGAQPSRLKQIAHYNAPGNYGMVSSLANFLFRSGWMSTDVQGQPSQGLYPGPVPAATRPMWNNLIPITWGLRVTDANQQAQLADLTTYQQLQVAPMEYTAPGSASLQPQLL